MRPAPETVYDMLQYARDDLAEARAVIAAFLADGSVVVAGAPELVACAKAAIGEAS